MIYFNFTYIRLYYIQVGHLTMKRNHLTVSVFQPLYVFQMRNGELATGAVLAHGATSSMDFIPVRGASTIALSASYLSPR